MSRRRPRVALGGFFLEANRWAPVTDAQGFAQGFDASGPDLLAELRSPTSRLLGDSLGFMAAMDQLGPWEPVPLRMAGAQPGGPADHDFFEALCASLEAALDQTWPVDAVFLAMHGAALTTAHDDPDGELLARLRARLGPQVPMVAVLDLHANVSERMCQSLSGLVAYRTNPHVDLHERGQEAARLLHAMLREGPGEVECVRLPLVPAATAMLIAPDTVYADLIALGQQAVGGDILNVSLCGGFALSDAPKCGFSVSVTARKGCRLAARVLALQLAEAVWAARERFTSQLTPLDKALRLAQAAGQGRRPPLMLADVGDNPGGGGGGNTTTLLRALVEFGVERAVLGVFTDAALAHRAHLLGVGSRFHACFNDGVDDAFAKPWRFEAKVLALSDGVFMGRQGLVQGTRREMGPSALLQVGDVQVVVISLRQQLLDPAQLEVLGVDLNAARVLVAKSRGHFRAAFAGFAAPEDIVEVDCPGLTTPNLGTLPWTRLPRPVYPLDEGMAWPASDGTSPPDPSVRPLHELTI